jgi:AraC-like DNA-binding protein
MKAELIADADIIGKKRIYVKEFEAPYFNHPLHFHLFAELVWIEQGHGTLMVGDHVGAFASGELILQGAELPHLWKSDNEYFQQGTTKATCIYFPVDLLEHITDDETSLAADRQLMQRAQRGLRFTGVIREEVIELIRRVRASNGLEQLALFLQIMDRLQRCASCETLAGVLYEHTDQSSDMNRFYQVQQYLLDNFTEHISLADAARICHLTPNAFCRYFKTRTQKSFTRFVNEMRIGYACKLLQQGNTTIKNVCYEAGYNNPVNFYKSFKTITKMTPLEYHRTLHN